MRQEALANVRSTSPLAEEQIYELFSQVGDVKRIIMGLDRHQKTPCGFCFVEFFQHNHALESLRYLSGTKLDERIIRADLDPGYLENRQYGRGKSGGQVRDEYREVRRWKREFRQITLADRGRATFVSVTGL